MKSLTWYIVRQVIGMTLLAALVLCFMVWLFRSLEAVDMMLNRGLPLSSFLHFASLTLPRFVLFVAPMAVFGAALFTYNKMTTDSELVVMRSAGLGPFDLAKPAIIVGVLISAVAYYFSLYLVPLTYREYKELEFKYRHNLPRLLLQEGVFSSPIPGFTVYFKGFGDEGELRDVLIHDNRNPRQPTTYMAERGKLRETGDGRWIVEMSQGGWQNLRQDGLRNTCAPKNVADGKAKNCDIPRFEIFVADSGKNLGGDLFSDEPKRGGGRHPREYFFTELLEPKLRPARNAAEIERNARDLRTLVAEFHTRLTQPLLPLTVALVGITILLSGHFNRRGQLKQIVVAVVAGGAVIIFSYVLRNYAPKMPALNAVMYVNALLPLILSLYFLIFPRPLTPRRGHQQREPAT